MIWTLDQDDYIGSFCRQGPFPFTQRVHDILFAADEYNGEEFSSSTRATRFQTKEKVSFVPIQRRTSPRQKSTLASTQSSSKSRNVGASVKNSSTLCWLLSVLLINILR